jgi:hypothetical protein
VHLLQAQTGNTIPVRLYDTDPGNPRNLCNIPAGQGSVPVIIVSDSAGPYPRHNRNGEFLGWGSDRPGATLIQFEEASGRVSRVETLSATGRPKARGAVAMDYVDVSSEGAFIENRLEVDWISGAESTINTPLYFIKANLTVQVHTTWQMFISEMIFASRVGTTWTRITTSYDASRNAFAVPATQTNDFRTFLRNATSRFITLKMGSNNAFIANRYDWDSYWNFEILVTTTSRRQPGTILGRQVGYELARPQREIESVGPDRDWRETPDFQWRRDNLRPKYG